VFSIIIPLYNKEKYVKRSIESVLLQSYKKYELIIVNDGSTDNSLEFVQQINKSTNQQINIINQQNQGVSIARNNGVKLSKYEYIAFLDADDWWHPDFLKEFSKLIEEFPEAGIYGCRYWIVKNGIEKIEPVGLSSLFNKGYINYFETYANNFSTPFNCSFVVVNKSIYEKAGGFNLQLKFGEDFELWSRISLENKIAYLNKPLAYSNQDVDVKHRAIGNQKIYSPSNHFIFNLEFLEEKAVNNLYIKKLLDGLRVRALFKYYLSGKFMKETINELKKVNFEFQPAYYRRIYKWPRFLIGIYFTFRFFVYHVVKSFRNTG
jgi:glycosyltransferase involved in cell wall biosynthesis